MHASQQRYLQLLSHVYPSIQGGLNRDDLYDRATAIAKGHGAFSV